MNKDKIRSIIASYLKGEITPIDEAVERIAACSEIASVENIAETIDMNYAVTNGGELTNAVDIARAILSKFDVRRK